MYRHKRSLGVAASILIKKIFVTSFLVSFLFCFGYLELEMLFELLIVNNSSKTVAKIKRKFIYLTIQIGFLFSSDGREAQWAQ
jgi:hypothetical protein